MAEDETSAAEVLKREAAARGELWSDEGSYDVFGERIAGQDDDMMLDEDLAMDDDAGQMATDRELDQHEAAFHETLVTDDVAADQLQDPALAVDDSDMTAPAATGEDESLGEKIGKKARELRDKI